MRLRAEEPSAVGSNGYRSILVVNTLTGLGATERTSCPRNRYALCNYRPVVARQEEPALNPTAITVRRSGRDVDPEIHDIDCSFTTDAIVEVRATGDGFTLTETAVSPPIKKEFPLDH